MIWLPEVTGGPTRPVRDKKWLRKRKEGRIRMGQCVGKHTALSRGHRCPGPPIATRFEVADALTDTLIRRSGACIEITKYGRQLCKTLSRADKHLRVAKHTQKSY